MHSWRRDRRGRVNARGCGKGGGGDVRRFGDNLVILDPSKSK